MKLKFYDYDISALIKECENFLYYIHENEIDNDCNAEKQIFINAIKNIMLTHELMIKNTENDVDNETEKLIEEVEWLRNKTPDGVVIDADTILVDLIEECDYEFSGFAQDIFNIWKTSTDKEAVEEMFYEFTAMEFNQYLIKCKEETTR